MAYTNIDDPSAYFQVATYTGNGSTQSITNDGNSDMQPDWVWIKSRSNASWHSLQDSSRGATKTLFTNTTNAEITYTDAQTSFDSDGFSLGADASGGSVNVSSRTYVAWQWKANGGTTVSNTDGSITSTVQANQDAGFSIVTWAGTASTATIGHGLGVAPKFMIVRARDKGVPTSWIVFHKDGSTSDDDYFILQGTFAKGTQAGLWNNQYPSSTVFGVANDFWVNSASTNYIAYCFAEKQGYSKFGSYVGNGNDNGPFIYTGFKPAFVLTKGTTVSQWRLYDSARSPNNVNINRLFPYTSSAEATDTDAGIDMLSNGFKIRGSGGDYNASGTTYIYMAFADNPFTTSTGIPTTAR